MMLATIFLSALLANAETDATTVAELDTRYQAAVERNDARAMDRLLADSFILITGNGTAYTKADLLKEATSRSATYEHQEDSERTVRVYGDTAVVTAKLWAKGTSSGKAFDYRLWFSDVWVRNASGWHYVFGQASTKLS